MKFYGRLKLGQKLPLMLVSITVVALLIMGVMSYHLFLEEKLMKSKHHRFNFKRISKITFRFCFVLSGFLGFFGASFLHRGARIQAYHGGS